jgi:hypothetical protein
MLGRGCGSGVTVRVLRGWAALPGAALILLPLGVGAQEPAPAETRAERLREARRKAPQTPPEPYRPTFLERQILAVEKAERPSILDFQYKGLHPRFQGISSGSRTAPALRFWRPELGGRPLSLHASAAYSIAGYQLYDAQLGLIPHSGQSLPARSTKGDDVYELGSLERPGPSHLILYASARYRHNPKERFFGVGPDSRLGDRSLYLLKDGLYELVGGYQFTPRIAATVRGGLLQVETGPGEDDDLPAVHVRFSDLTAPGLYIQPDFYRVQGTLLLDGRDRPWNPHGGGMLALSVARFSDRDHEGFGFRRIAVDARGYVSLGSPQRVLAARVLASSDDPDEGARVPFYLMDSLSNSHTLRGFQSLRFRDERLLSLQAEYRWEAAPALELALFCDAGRAFQGDWSLEDLETAYGVGLRIKSHEAVLARFDLARSDEGTRLYVRFGGSF